MAFFHHAGTVSALSASDLDIGTILTVDSVNTRVGVGTASPGATLGIDGDLHFQPTAISTSHITTAGSLDVRCTNNMKLGTDGADSIRIGRVNTSAAKVHIRSGADTDLVVSGGKVGIGMEDPSDALEIDGDIQLTPTAISTAHLKTTGSLDVRASGNIKIGTDGADSVRLGRVNTTAAKIHLRSGADTDLVVFNSQVGIGTETPKTSLTVEGAVTLKEQADADSDTAGYGQLWVNTATPNELYYTTDAGDDIQLTTSTSMAASSGVNGSAGVAAGAGFTGSNSGATTTVAKINNEYVTTILVDIHDLIENGMNAKVIGEGSSDAAYLTKITSAVNGLIYKVEMSCVEVPAGSGATLDIDLYGNTSSTLKEGDAAAGVAIITSGAVWAVGRRLENTAGTALTDGLANYFLYLANGDFTGTGSDYTYTAGQFVIKLYGSPPF